MKKNINEEVPVEKCNNHNDCCGHHHGKECEHHKHEDENSLLVKVFMHEHATIASACFVSNDEIDILQEDIARILEDIASWVTENNGIIGHLKSSLQTEGETIMLSLTDEKVESKRVKSKKCKISMACIVFGIDERDMEKKLSEDLEVYKK